MYRDRKFQYPTLGQQCQSIFLALFFIAALITLGWSIGQISQSYIGEADRNAEMYVTDEELWNSTYLNEFKWVKINMIKDPEVYDEIQESISQKQAEILSLEQNNKN